ncbi:hypothetical protein GCM10009825_24840 [Arthrobacter humicola]|uniref:MFS transporter n=1 Tax=Arthrobacter humicola TaxID=409291 RepID=A0ABN2Z8L3_9MICC
MASAARPATRALRLVGTVAMLGQIAASMVTGAWGTVYGTVPVTALVTAPAVLALVRVVPSVRPVPDPVASVIVTELPPVKGGVVF